MYTLFSHWLSWMHQKFLHWYWQLPGVIRIIINQVGPSFRLGILIGGFSAACFPVEGHVFLGSEHNGTPLRSPEPCWEGSSHTLALRKWPLTLETDHTVPCTLEAQLELQAERSMIWLTVTVRGKQKSPLPMSHSNSNQPNADSLSDLPGSDWKCAFWLCLTQISNHYTINYWPMVKSNSSWKMEMIKSYNVNAT